MARGELTDKELYALRQRSPYEWAVWLTLVCWALWPALAVGVLVLLVLPGTALAQIVLGVLAVAVAATLGKAVAVETLFSRWLDRSRKDRTRADIRELNRRQVYRASRRDAFALVRAFLAEFVFLFP